MKHEPDCIRFSTVFQYTEIDEAVGYAMCDRLQALLSETAQHAYEITVGYVDQYGRGDKWYARVNYCELDKETVEKAYEIASTVRVVVDMPDELRTP